MKQNFVRGIACVIALVNVMGLLPAQDFAAGKSAGMARLERELDRASLERDPVAWQNISGDGLSFAMAEWETRTLSLREEDPLEWNSERDRAEGEFRAASAKEYAEWLSDRFFGERGIARERAMMAELANKSAEWNFSGKDGTSGRVISPESVAEARAQWRKNVSAPMIDEYLLAWETENDPLSQKLRESLADAGVGPQEIDAVVKAGRQKAAASARDEYSRVAKIEENSVIRSLLYDANSLRKESESRAASAIADRIAEETRTATESEMDRVLDSLDEAFDGGDRTGIEIDADSWMSSFRASMERAMAKWESAESEFLVKRSEWEKEAQRVYLDGEQSWADAFAKLRKEREKWQGEMRDRFDEGAEKWKDRKNRLSEMLIAARDEFDSVSREETRKTMSLLDLDISIYEQSRSMIEMSVQAIGGWHEEWADRYAEVYSFWKSESTGYFPSGPLLLLGLPPTDKDTDIRRARILEWKTAARDMLQRQLGQERDRKVSSIAALEAKILKCKEDQDIVLKQIKYLDPRMSDYHEESAKLTQQLANLKKNETDDLAESERIRKQVNDFSEYEDAFFKRNCGTTTGSEIDELVKCLNDKLVIDDSRLSKIGDAWDAADGLIRWSELVDAYRTKADGAMQSLLNIAGNVAGVSAGKTYYDELDIESLKAKAISKHWADELAIAEAVDYYATNRTSTEEWSAETLKKLASTRKEYESAIGEYDAEVDRLDAALKDSRDKTDAMEAARKALALAEEKVKSARTALSEATLAINGVGLDALRDKLDSLTTALQDSWLGCQSDESVESAAALEYYRYARENAQATADAIVNRLIAGLINGSDVASDANPSLSAMRDSEAAAATLALGESVAQYEAIGNVPEEYASLREIISSRYGVLADPESSDAERKVARLILSDSWRVVSSYWKDKIREREACVSYLLTGKTGYENLEPNDELASAEPAEKWFVTQRRLISDELSIIDSEEESESSIARKFALESLSADVDCVLKAGIGVNRTREIDRLRAISPDFSALIAMESPYENVCPGWASYLYRLETFDCAERRSYAHQNAVSLYAPYAIAVINAAHGASLAGVNSLIAKADIDSLRGFNADGMPIDGAGSLIEYISSLEDAGSGLNASGQEALQNYIWGIVEYASTRYAIDGSAAIIGSQKNVIELQESAEAAARDYSECGLWKEWLRDYSGSLDVALSKTFRVASNEIEKKEMGVYISTLLMDKLSRDELESCKGKESLREILSSEGVSDRVSFDKIQRLDEVILEAIADSIASVFGVGDVTVADSELLADWFRLGTGDPARRAQVFRDDPRIQACLDADELISRLRGCLDEDDLSRLRADAEKANHSDLLESIIAVDAAKRLKPYVLYRFGGADTLLYYVLGDCPSEDLMDALDELGSMNRRYADIAREYRNVVDAARAYSPLVDGPVDEWLARRKGIAGWHLTNSEKKRAAKSISTGLVDLETPLHIWDARDELKPRELDPDDSSVGQRLASLTNEKYLAVMAGLVRMVPGLAKKSRESFWISQLSSASARQIDADDVSLMRDVGLGDTDENRVKEALLVVKARMSVHSAYLSSAACATDILPFSTFDSLIDPDTLVVQAQTNMRNARDYYLSFEARERGLRETIRECLARIEVSTGSEAEKKARVRAAETRILEARTEYESAAKALNDASSGMQVAFSAYNAQVDAINGKYEIAEEKKLDLLKAQKVHDWATSVYLDDLGSDSDSSYETPREILTRVRYAAKRAETASKVLLELKGENGDPETMRLPLDPEYSAAFDEYEKSVRRYYQTRAARYEAERRMEIIKQDVRDAEHDEREALGNIAIDVVSLDPTDSMAIDLINISRVEATGEYNIGFDVGNSNVSDEDSVVAYFLDESDSIDRLDGKEYQTRAKGEAIEWFISVEKRLDSETYLADLGLASLYAKMLAVGKDDDYQSLFGDGSGDKVPPIDVNGFWPEPFAAILHGEDLAEIYRQGRVKAVKDAYDTVIADQKSRDDLARYALYRDTVLKPLKFAQSEKAQLEIRAMSHVRSQLDVIIQNAMNNGIFYAAEAATLSVPAIYCAPLWIAVGALTALSWTNFDKANSLSGVRSDVERNQNSKSAYASAIRSDWDTDYAMWREKCDRLKERQDALSTCVASIDPGEGARMTYANFVVSLERLLGDSNYGISLEDAKSAYSEDTFNASGASYSINAYEARAIIEAYCSRDAETKRAKLENVAARSLIKIQRDGMEEFSSLRSASIEMPPDTKNALHELAKRSSDKSLSVELRKQAEADYESLAKDLDLDSNIQGYEKAMRSIADKSLGSGTWFNRYHDNRMNELNHSLGKANAVYGRSVEPFVRENLLNFRESIFRSLVDSQTGRLGIKVAEWDLAVKTLDEDYDEWERQFTLVMKCSDEAWGGAESRVQTEYANWRKVTKDDYEEKVNDWKTGYDEFLDSMQGWIDDQYVYAASVGSASVLEDSGLDVDAVIASATRKTFLDKSAAVQSGFDSSKYVSKILDDTVLCRMSNISLGLADRADTGGETMRRYASLSSDGNAEIADAIVAVGEISADMTNASAALAARQARTLLRNARESYAVRLDGENAAMREWERDLALNAGYSIGSEISRSAVVDATVMNNIRDRQTLHKYEDFTSVNENIARGFDDASLKDLDGNAIMIALARAQNELRVYGESIFGKTDETGSTKRWNIPRTMQESSESDYAAIQSKPETVELMEEIQSFSASDYESLSDAEKERRANKINSVVSIRDGAFGRHVGFAPLFKTGGELDLSKSREENLKYGGMGEIGKILLDYQWNSFLENKGYSELSRSIYDKRLWDDRGMSVKAPTARGVADLAMSIVAMAYGNNPFIGLIDDGVFAMIDYAGGYKSVEQIACELGVKVVCTAICSGVSWGGSQLASLASGLTEIGKVALNAGVAGVSGAVSTASTGFVSEIDFSKLGTSDWFDSEGFAERMTDPRTWANAVGSTVSAGISGGLSLYSGDAASKFFKGAIELAAGIGGEAARYGVFAATSLASGGSFADALDEMGGITINLLDFGGLADFFGTAIGNGNGSGQTGLGAFAGKTQGAGLLELHFGTNGMYAQLGSTGVNVGGALYRLTKGVNDKTILDNYKAEHAEDGKGDAAYYAYVYGDWSAETTSRRIAMGKDELIIFSDTNSGTVAQTTQNGNGRKITFVDSGNDLNNAVSLQHESHRDGTVTNDNALETTESVIAHARIASEMKKRGLDIDLSGLLGFEVALYDSGDFRTLSAIASNCYDSSGDFWKVTSTGDFAYDGKANVYDPNGIMIRKTKSQGIEGSMLEILGLEDNEKNRAAVVSMMKSSGLEQDTKGNWIGTDVSVNRPIPYSATLGSYLVNHANLTSMNMGKEISLYSIDSLFTDLGSGKETYQNFIEKNYLSALGFNTYVNGQTNQKWAQDIYTKAYTANERSRIEANMALLQAIMSQGIDYSKVVPSANQTTAFGEEINVNLSTSSVAGAISFFEQHTGVDYGSGGTGVYTPGGFWEVIDKDNHKLYLQLYGTDIKMRIMHLDPTKVDAINLGKIIGSVNGTKKIIDYPTASFGSGNGAHTHIDFTRSFAGASSYYRSFMNPSNWMNGSQLEYQYIYYGADLSPLAGYPKNFYRY